MSAALLICSTNADAKYRHGLVAQKSDHASGGKPAEMHHVTRVEKPVDGFIPSHQCAQQNDQDNGETGEVLDPAITIGKGLCRLPTGKHEGNPERYGRTGIGDVVDGVRE